MSSPPRHPPAAAPIRSRSGGARRLPAIVLLPAILLLSALAAVAGTAPALAGTPADPASWKFFPVSAPAPPAGVEPTNAPVPLGQIGQISFWTPNRGLLITGGTGSSCAESADALVPCGLYAYNGQNWHLLSSVCGGAEGRIAWAGPDEFWTISDQRPGQNAQLNGDLTDVSLCHFLDGQVVGSYAMPLDQPDSYAQMSAAACLSPDNCWFGGAVGRAPNGAFHLHWNGETVSVVYSPQDHAVVSMALANQTTLLESVAPLRGDRYGAEESEAHPDVLHELDPPGASVEFHSLFLPDPACAELEFCPPLPDYGYGVANGPEETGGPVAPYTLAGLQLSSDYYPAQPVSQQEEAEGKEGPQVWAIAGPNKAELAHPDEEAQAHPIALRYAKGVWRQVVGGEGPGGGPPGGEEPFQANEQPENIAAEPGSSAAWVTLYPEEEGKGGTAHTDEARVEELSAEGKVIERDTLGAAQEVGARGSAGAIACPAPHECWLATQSGWLFHLVTPEREADPLALDTDPNFAGVISFRPLDGGVAQLPSAEAPPDDSLANQQPPPPPPLPTVTAPVQLARKPLVTDMHSRVVHNTLELSFRLTVKAHVQLLASKGHHKVAQTRKETLKAGKHTLSLSLNPRQWPTKLNLKATPLEALPTEPVKGTSTHGEGAAAPPVSSNSVST
jgi:hypothetical protein